LRNEKAPRNGSFFLLRRFPPRTGQGINRIVIAAAPTKTAPDSN
jgi:hypothetical protein